MKKIIISSIFILASVFLVYDSFNQIKEVKASEYLYYTTSISSIDNEFSIDVYFNEYSHEFDETSKIARANIYGDDVNASLGIKKVSYIGEQIVENNNVYVFRFVLETEVKVDNMYISEPKLTIYAGEKSIEINFNEFSISNGKINKLSDELYITKSKGITNIYGELTGIYLEILSSSQTIYNLKISNGLERYDFKNVFIDIEKEPMYFEDIEFEESDEKDLSTLNLTVNNKIYIPLNEAYVTNNFSFYLSYDCNNMALTYYIDNFAFQDYINLTDSNKLIRGDL